MDEAAAKELLQSGEYGVLSINCESNGAYGLPISYVWDGNSFIYLHCAPSGKKLICIENNPNVSFCIVGKTNVIREKFTTEYESIILSCTAKIRLSEEERMKALLLFIDKYSPGFKETGIKYAEKSFHLTEIIRLEISNWSGKNKRLQI
jgi:nitroimidazol reductase NimA-like FMN-containing flavoprotein (pyridoxamine 5'-phosphate oxidase superfamily)